MSIFAKLKEQQIGSTEEQFKDSEESGDCGDIYSGKIVSEIYIEPIKVK